MGKTTLIQYLRRQVGQNLELAFLSNTNLSADQLLSYILIELNIEPETTGKAHNLNLFKNYLKSLNNEGRRIILVIDEAQNLPKDALEEVRMLSNFQADDIMPLQIFLIGQPELRTILKSPVCTRFDSALPSITTSTVSAVKKPKTTSNTA